MTALIVDDEPLARALLRQQLQALEVEVVGEAADSQEAVKLAEELWPDLVFLDIRMPGMSGIEAASLFAELEQAPLVVLVTGSSEHAVEAFDKSALDYLLKPVGSERLEQTIRKARRLMSLRQRAQGQAKPRVLPRGVKRLPIREKGGFRILPVETILYAASTDKVVMVHTRSAEYRTNYTLSYLDEVLPSGFMRVHASCIVNLSAIEEILIVGNHSYALRVANGHELPVGRTQYSKLQERLGFPP